MKAAHPHFPGCERTAARSPLVQQSRLWQPAQRLVLTSSSVSLTGHATSGLSAILRPGRTDESLDFGRYLRALSTKGGVPSQPGFEAASLFGHLRRLAVIHNDGSSIDRAANWVKSARSQKCFPVETQIMSLRIATRAIVTIQNIGWAAIIIVMGLFLTVIGTSITECLANPR